MPEPRPAPAVVPVLAVPFPDGGDLPRWVARCREADARAAHAATGRIAVPGLTLRAQVTYPLLRLDPAHPRAAAWVYLVWRGRVWARQAAAGPDALTALHLAGMDPVLAAGMIVGARYAWVYAAPQPTPAWPAPTLLRRGLLTHGAGPEVLPLWL